MNGFAHLPSPYRSAPRWKPYLPSPSRVLEPPPEDPVALHRLLSGSEFVGRWATDLSRISGWAWAALELREALVAGDRAAAALVALCRGRDFTAWVSELAAAHVLAPDRAAVLRARKDAKGFERMKTIVLPVLSEFTSARPGKGR